MTEKRRLVADFHMHTIYSHDSVNDFQTLFQTAREHGINVLGITDHNTVEGAKHVKRIAPSDMLVLLGQEVMTLSGEIIVYDVEETIPKKIDLLETCKLVKEKGGFIIIPHPFDGFRNGIGEKMLDIMPYIDAIESINPRSFREKANKKAKEFAEEHKIPMVSGSDCHTKMEIGSARNIIIAEADEKSVLEAIKTGTVIIDAKRTGLRPHITTLKLAIKKKLRMKKL